MEPLENVLDFYGGNSEKMREVADEFDTEELFGIDDEPVEPVLSVDSEDLVTENLPKGHQLLKQLNSHMKGNLVVAPSSMNKEDF